jgi:hypothetical protein
MKNETRCVALWSVGRCIFFLAPSFDQYLANTRPHVIDTTSGHVFELRVRGGAIVYMDKKDAAIEAAFTYGGAIFLVLCGLLVAADKRRSVSKENNPRKPA